MKLLESPESRNSLRLFLILIIITFALNNLAEITYLSFQDTFLQSLPDVHITAGQAAEVGSITATSYTVGRAASILVSMILSPGNVLTIHYGLGMIGFAGLLWTTRTSAIWIKVNSGLIGYALSAIMPASYAFINSYSGI